MKRLLAALVLLTACLPGCLAGTVGTATYFFGSESMDAGSMRMNYHADLPEAWEASLAQLSDMGITSPDIEKPGRTRAVISAGDVTITLETLKPREGTMISVLTDMERQQQISLARTFLQGVAARLDDYNEAIRLDEGVLETIWDATKAEMIAMGYPPTEDSEVEITTPVGTRYEARSGGYRFIAEKSGNGNYVRVRIRGDFRSEVDFDEAARLLAGVASRVRQ